MESRILSSINPESHERLEMESKLCRQGIGIRGGAALGRNVDPIYNKAKSYYHVLVAFPSFYSLLFIDPLPLFTDMVLILFSKIDFRNF